jgi:hypothetical protein
MEHTLRNFLRSTVRTIRRINQKYSKPRIQQSRMVRISLLLLRLYLLLMVGILLYKFVTLVVK